MKWIVLSLLVAVILQVVVENTLADAVCRNDKDCKRNECCATGRFSGGKSCKDKGNEVGDRCGGDYLCSCETGFACKPDTHVFWNKFRFGTGTCQRNNMPNWRGRYGRAK